MSSESQMLYCRACGKQLHQSASACPSCGARQTAANVSDKKILIALLLCFFFGVLGVHRFYVGKVGTGILQLLTLGGLGLWAFIDFILVAVGAFTDGSGAKVTEWT